MAESLDMIAAKIKMEMAAPPTALSPFEIAKRKYTTKVCTNYLGISPIGCKRML